MKCPHCKTEIEDDEPLKWRGIADVDGHASLREFHDNGIVWTAHDSENEEAQCPKCEQYFTPKFED